MLRTRRRVCGREGASATAVAVSLVPLSQTARLRSAGEARHDMRRSTDDDGTATPIQVSILSSSFILRFRSTSAASCMRENGRELIKGSLFGEDDVPGGHRRRRLVTPSTRWRRPALVARSREAAEGDRITRVAASEKASLICCCSQGGAACACESGVRTCLLLLLQLRLDTLSAQQVRTVGHESLADQRILASSAREAVRVPVPLLEGHQLRACDCGTV